VLQVDGYPDSRARTRHKQVGNRGLNNCAAQVCNREQGRTGASGGGRRNTLYAVRRGAELEIQWRWVRGERRKTDGMPFTVAMRPSPSPERKGGVRRGAPRIAGTKVLFRKYLGGFSAKMWIASINRDPFRGGGWENIRVAVRVRILISNVGVNCIISDRDY
jgi:hypothetical protein